MEEPADVSDWFKPLVTGSMATAAQSGKLTLNSVLDAEAKKVSLVALDPSKHTKIVLKPGESILITNQGIGTDKAVYVPEEYYHLHHAPGTKPEKKKAVKKKKKMPAQPFLSEDFLEKMTPAHSDGDLLMSSGWCNCGKLHGPPLLAVKPGSSHSLGNPLAGWANHHEIDTLYLAWNLMGWPGNTYMKNHKPLGMHSWKSIAPWAAYACAMYVHSGDKPCPSCLNVLPTYCIEDF